MNKEQPPDRRPDGNAPGMEHENHPLPRAREPYITILSEESGAYLVKPIARLSAPCVERARERERG